MANYFSNRDANYIKKVELRKALHAIHVQEKAERKDYLHNVEAIIKSKPGLTAEQYANLLSDNAAERNSIAASIAGMGFNATQYRLGREKVCSNPSIPALARKRDVIKRRFMELDETGNSLGIHEVIQYKTVYSIKED